jgi:hypothetical protein
MRVLFLALGATRRLAVTEESARVAAAGGWAVVLVDQAKPWRDGFAHGVHVIEAAQVESGHRPRVIEKALLFRAPKRLFRLVGRGRLAPSARRAARAYERRIANPLHRRVFLPAYRRLWRRARPRLIHHHLPAGASFDLLVVGDPASMPTAVGILDRYRAGGRLPPEVAFGLDYAAAGGPDPAAGEQWPERDR